MSTFPCKVKIFRRYVQSYVRFCAFSVFLFHVFGFQLHVLAQSKLPYTVEKGVFFLKGYILQKDTSKPISGASIFNKQKLTGTLSNVKGAFMIRMHKTDTIYIQCMGYQPMLFYFADTAAEFPNIVKFPLEQKVYELPVVSVYGYRIRRRYKPVEIDLRRTDHLTIDLGPSRGSAAGFAGRNDYLLPAGLSLGDIYEMFSAKAKEQRKVRELELMDHVKKYIHKRYNKNFVSQYSGLKGDELDNFMRFCPPPERLVIDGTDYELAYHIRQCLLDFQSKY